MTQTQMTAAPPNDPSSFAAMFEATASGPSAALGGEGQIVSGVIIQVNRDSVVVDIGGKSEGVISKSEFADANAALPLNARPPLAVFLHSRERDDRPLSLSHA